MGHIAILQPGEGDEFLYAVALYLLQHVVVHGLVPLSIVIVGIFIEHDLFHGFEIGAVVILVRGPVGVYLIPYIFVKSVVGYHFLTVNKTDILDGHSIYVSECSIDIQRLFFAFRHQLLQHFQKLRPFEIHSPYRYFMLRGFVVFVQAQPEINVGCLLGVNKDGCGEQRSITGGQELIVQVCCAVADLHEHIGNAVVGVEVFDEGQLDL